MVRLVWWCLCTVLAACAGGARLADADPRLARIEAVLAGLGPGVEAAYWLGPPSGAPELAWRAEAPMPVASTIKAAYLVEWFAAHPDRLDEPSAAAAAILADDQHVALRHFSAAARATARTALAGASVRRIAEAMISGRGVDNPTYNAAANVVTAWAGGPAALTTRLHARSPAWQGLQVRRYMLADRTEHGDNTATGAALAAVFGMLANRAVPGMPSTALEAARHELRLARPPAGGGSGFGKDGALASEPLTRVYAGWVERDREVLVHVVMLARHGVPETDRAVANTALAAAAKRIEAILLAGDVPPDPAR